MGKEDTKDIADEETSVAHEALFVALVLKVGEWRARRITP